MRVTVGEGMRFASGSGDPAYIGDWPAKWIHLPQPAEGSFVAAYRLTFDVAEEITARLHVSADQRYELLLDGRRLGRGPERGDEMCWFYESYEAALSPGRHTLVARVWWLQHDGAHAPNAQRTIRPGFLLAAEAPLTEQLSTGIAPWQAKRLGGYTFRSPTVPGASLAGGTLELDGRAFDWGWELGQGNGWQPAVSGWPARDRLNRWGEDNNGHRLRPAILPAMKEVLRHLGNVRNVAEAESADTSAVPVTAECFLRGEHPAWQRLFGGAASHTIPPHTRRRVIVDLEDYYCAYPQLTLTGGRDAIVRLHWAESLYLDPRATQKGNRDQIEGKYFIGRGDTFIADGGQARTFDTLWWACGRYIELYVETKDEPLAIDDIAFRETGYPLHMDGQVELSDERFNRAVPIMWRTMQMCMHETYMDCPYYEQLMYTGDTRLEVLVTYLMCRDDRLPRKAIRMFALSQNADGLTHSRYPSHITQIIPQFSLFFVAMLHDFALWRGDREFVLQFMPRARAVMEVFIQRINEQGLVDWPEGWNWVDWVPGWQHGLPPCDWPRHTAINNWQFVYVAGLAAKLERWLGETALADRLDRIRRRVASATTDAFWDESAGLFADTLSRSSYSEHAQCYALLSGLVPPEREQRVLHGLLNDPRLARATIYFQHYLFEVLARYGRPDAMLDRWQLWYDHVDLGMKTCLESPEPSRSDCHAWGAHPIYHVAASIAGVRPAELGAGDVVIRPQLGRLKSVRCTIRHPRGPIHVDLRCEDAKLTGTIELPEALAGRLILPDGERALQAGANAIG